MKNFKNLAYLVAIAAGMLGCDGALETTNTRAMVEVERNLEVTTSVDDHLGGSTVTFDQSSTIDASVLILVLMDNQNTHLKDALKVTNSSLNPCSNG